MSETSTAAKPKRQMNVRLPESLRTRVEELRFHLSKKYKKRVTNDDLAISALDQYLKKFGF